MDDLTLAPCPFCGGAPQCVEGPDFTRLVACRDCGATGPDAFADADAVAVWNAALLVGSPPLPAEVPAGHVRVRVAVMTLSAGGYFAEGYSDAIPFDLAAYAEEEAWAFAGSGDNDAIPGRLSWIVADVPLPAPPPPPAEVVGVVDAEEDAHA